MTVKQASLSGRGMSQSAQVEVLMDTLYKMNEVLKEQIDLIAAENAKGGEEISSALVLMLEHPQVPEDVRTAVMPAFIRMQDNDIMQQQLIHLQKTLTLLNDRLMTCIRAQQGEAAWPELEAIPDEVYSTYVMQQQRRIHNQVLGLEDVNPDQTSKVDFF